MVHAPVAKLKATLSKYLLRVKSGEEVIVTERGKPIARIVPILRDDRAFSKRLIEMERAGLLKLGSGKIPEAILNTPGPEDTHGLALKALVDEREDGR